MIEKGYYLLGNYFPDIYRPLKIRQKCGNVNSKNFYKLIHNILVENNDLTSYFSTNQPFNLRGFLAEIEEKMISAAMQQSDGSMEIAAEKLGITPEDLLEKIKDFENKKEFRELLWH